jgi:peptidoglycan/LPS O-acetylase OafA/YrhL
VIGTQHYFPSLTGFRAIAAWLIFINHYNPFAPQRFPFLSGLVDELSIGVSMFFVLSGFLIAIRYDDPLQPKPGFGVYMRNRFARIYPLYFILTTLTFVVIGEWGWTYIANITFVKGFSDELKFTGIAQGWSLTVEETFYFLAPFLFLAIRKFKGAILLWPLVFLGTGMILFGSFDFMLIYTFFGRSFEFFVGISLAKIYQQRQPIDRKVFTWIGILVLTTCLVALVFTQSRIIHQVFVPVATGLLLWGLITEKTWLQRILSGKVMQLLGKSSYAFYLIHIGIIASLFTVNIAVLFVILNAVAVLLYYTIERPLQTMIKRLSRQQARD